MIQLKAIIFDYGNVLCEPQRTTDLVAMADVLDTPISSFEEIYWRFRLPYDKAELDGAAYWSKVAEPLGRELSRSQIERLIELDVGSWSRPEACMIEWAGRVREAGLRTALLSNLPMDLRVHLTTKCDWLPAFHHLTFSCDVRATKPDAAIYRSCLEGLGVPAGECLFLDDRTENIEAAQQLGIHALLFTTAQKTIAAMQERFVAPAPLPC
jgi:putative hydrolase of the HAD superfamily